MGCDIHLFLERKTNKGWVINTPYGKGEYVTNIQIIDNYPRCYMLFGILAGVRNNCVRPIAQPRGVPDDCCKEYRAFVDEWDGDGHNHSFFGVSELKAAINKYTGDEKALLEEFTEHIMKMIDVMRPWMKGLEQPEEYRVCFFFDN